MKIKMKTKYLFQLSAFLLGIVIMFGCAEFDEYESLDVDPAPSLSLALVSAADSTITVDITSSMSGYVAAILLSGTGNEVPDSAALLTVNVLYDEYQYMEVVANEAVSFTYSSVIQDSDYEVMAVSANEDGMVSEVSVLEVTTSDSYAPQLISSAPDISYGPVLDPSSPLVLTFDEPVVLGAGVFTYEVPWSGIPAIEIPEENIIVDGATIQLSLPDGYFYGDYLWLHYEEGAVVDATGNETPALSTYYDADLGAFFGLYWSVVNITMEPEGIAPDAEVEQAPGFDIVLTFSDVIDIEDLADGDITLTYSDPGVTWEVPLIDVLADANTLTISQNVYSASTGTVTVDIPEGVITVYYGNPVVAVSETWNLEPLAR
jgi:hypothetical protein